MKFSENAQRNLVFVFTIFFAVTLLVGVASAAKKKVK
jgi:hypothetical protein